MYASCVTYLDTCSALSELYSKTLTTGSSLGEGGGGFGEALGKTIGIDKKTLLGSRKVNCSQFSLLISPPPPPSSRASSYSVNCHDSRIIITGPVLSIRAMVLKSPQLSQRSWTLWKESSLSGWHVDVVTACS